MNLLHHYKFTFHEQAVIWGLYGLTVGLCLFWFTDYSQRIISADMILLTHYAQDFLLGKTMSEAYLDTNPPMSIVVYSIPALLIKYLGLSVFDAVNYFTIALLVFSVFLTSSLLRYFLARSIDRHFIVCAYILSNTLFIEIFFGSKDQFIFMALMPFCLLQLVITHQYKIPKILEYATLIFGAFFLLIKPLFYIIPVTLFLYRIYARKKISSVFDKDSLFLTLFAFAYCASLLTYFNDYITVIFPDVIDLYFTMRNPSTPWISALSFAIIALTGAGALQFIRNRHLLKFTVIFLFWSGLSVIVAHIQYKGHFLHYIPALGFYVVAFSITFYSALSSLFGKKSNFIWAEYIRFGIVFTLLSAFSFLFLNYPTRLDYRDDYRQHELAQYVVQHTDPYDEIYIASVFSEYPHAISAITKRKHISRFPSLWFWLQLRHSDSIKSEEKRDVLLRKYMSMVAEDIAFHRPELLFFEHFRLEYEGKIFDFYEDMMEYGKSSHLALQDYEYKEVLRLEKDPHMPAWLPETTPFSVYMRK